MEAITAAITVLGWFELPEEDQPPENYWHSADLVNEWFRSVKQRQADRRAGRQSIPQMEASEDDFVDEEVAALRG